MNFIEKLLAASRKHNSLLCVGLDPEPSRFPPILLGEPVETAIMRFCHSIIEATSPYVCAYKPNLAFFEVLGPIGMAVLQQVIHAIPHDIPIIVDAKRGDIGNSARNYAAAIFDVYHGDAVTVNPYLGYDSIAPFLAYQDKGIFLLCRTSNPSAHDFQDVLVQADDGHTRPLYEVIALRAQSWNEAGNCGLVVGATSPQQMQSIRVLCPDLPILIPGIGEQGGDLEASVQAGVDAQGERAIVSVSRSILYAGKDNDYAAEAARQAQFLREQINVAGGR
ncbi:MAG: orotidine-5'-phosphate decarboxylase [Ktedonobacteraceae bacterium]|nr:orotidine-5'-phosphate decarboxylase [Ktedonobacteraceae bacterium]